MYFNTGMIKVDDSSSSIILAGQALLVKMLISLEPRYAFGSNFEYFFPFFFLFFFFIYCFFLISFILFIYCFLLLSFSLFSFFLFCFCFFNTYVV